LSLKAYRLNNSFTQLYKDKKFTGESLKAAGINRANIFEEIPITIHSSLLATAFMAELSYSSGTTLFNELEVCFFFFLS